MTLGNSSRTGSLEEPTIRPSRIRLLIYSHFFPPSVGGVETVVSSLARGLAGLRNESQLPVFDVTVVSRTPLAANEQPPSTFPVIRLPGAAELFRLIRAHDVVHVAGPAIFPILISLLLRKPLVLEHHGFQAICPNGQLLIEPSGVPCPGHFMLGDHGDCIRCNFTQGKATSIKLWALTFLRRWLCRMATVNVTPTAWLGSVVQLPHMVTIPHGIEGIPAFQRLAGHSRQLVYQGRLVTTKGVRVLFEAAKLLREKGQLFELRIVGDGPERSALEGLSREWEMTSYVEFLGRLKASDVDAMLSQAFAVIVPSLGGEVFGLVVIENMQRGIPVVASALGAFVEVIGECGVTFPVGDPVALANVLYDLFNRPEQAADLGRKGSRRVAAEFAFDRMIEAHAGVYRLIYPK